MFDHQTSLLLGKPQPSWIGLLEINAEAHSHTLLLGRNIGDKSESCRIADIDLQSWGGETNGVSSQHAEIQPVSQEIRVLPHTTNETYLNNYSLKIDRFHKLRSNDTLKIGNVELTIKFVSGDEIDYHPFNLTLTQKAGNNNIRVKEREINNNRANDKDAQLISRARRVAERVGVPIGRALEMVKRVDKAWQMRTHASPDEPVHIIPKEINSPYNDDSEEKRLLDDNISDH